MAGRGRQQFTAGFNPKAVVAELMAATLFIYIGCGTATTFSAQRGNNDFQLESVTNRTEGDTAATIEELSNNVATTGSWGITTALAFGLAITVLAYATAHLLGGQPAASGGQHGSADRQGHPGGRSRSQAPLAIGFAVFCAHAVLLPIDGCSINPARSLGPAIVSGTWPPTFWVFIVGPFLGAIASVPLHLFFASNLFSGSSGDSHDPLALGTGTGTRLGGASGASGKSSGTGGASPQRLTGVAGSGGDSAAATPRFHAAEVV